MSNSGLTKSDKFVLLVSAFVNQHAASNWPSFREDLGADGIMRVALAIPESIIPDDYATASGEFCDHVTHLRYPNMQKPEWFPNNIIDYKRFRHKDEWAALGITE